MFASVAAYPDYVFEGPKQCHNAWSWGRNKQLTSLLDLALGSKDFLLLYGGSIGIESTKLLRLLPSKNTVGSRFVLSRWHYIFINSGEIREICSGRRRACVDHL